MSKKSHPYPLAKILLILILISGLFLIAYKNNPEQGLLTNLTSKKVSNDWQIYKDSIFNFSVKLPPEYNLEKNPNDDSSLTNAIWFDLSENVKIMQFKPSDSSTWKADNGKSESEKNLYFRHFSGRDIGNWRQELAANRSSQFIIQETELGNNAVLLIAGVGAASKKDDYIRDTFLVIPHDLDLLVISTNHFKNNQAEVNDLLLKMYSTFTKI